MGKERIKNWVGAKCELTGGETGRGEMEKGQNGKGVNWERGEVGKGQNGKGRNIGGEMGIRGETGRGGMGQGQNGKGAK
jgi:hypothetical protein